MYTVTINIYIIIYCLFNASNLASKSASSPPPPAPAATACLFLLACTPNDCESGLISLN